MTRISPLLAGHGNPARDEDLRWATIAELPWREARGLIHQWGSTGAIDLETRLIMLSLIACRIPPEERARLIRQNRARQARPWDDPSYPGVRPGE